MQILNLIAFELKKQVKSSVFIIVALLFVGFTISQTIEIFHYPIKSEKDIKVLANIGERDYLYVKASETEFVTAAIENLKSNFESDEIDVDGEPKFKNVINSLKSNGFEYTYEVYKADNYIEPWLRAVKVQFEYKLGTVEQVNTNMKQALGEHGYLKVLHSKYVTYVQICAAFVIFPIFLLMLTRDSNSKTTEVIYTKPMDLSLYLICRYIASLIIVSVLFYGLGVIFSFISIYNFKASGWKLSYSFFIKDFMIFIFPTIFYLSAFIIFLGMILRKTSAMLPIYAIYVIYNVTPKAFGNKYFSVFSRAVLRLDRELLSLTDILINRGIYIVIGIFLITISCKLYKKISYNIERVNIA